MTKPHAPPLLSGLARATTFTAIAFMAVRALGLGVVHARGDRLLSVQTASMRPTIEPGDAVLVKPLKPKQLLIGEVISYASPRNQRVVISHRLIAINARTGWLTAQGDALHQPDPSFPPTLVIGQVTAVAPGLGRVLNILRRSFGLALVIYLPAAIILIAEIRRLGYIYARPFYSARLES